MAQIPKITPEEKKQIIAQFQSGLSKYRIAKNHNISQTMVSYIIDPEKLVKNRKLPVNKNKNNERVRRCRKNQKHAKKHVTFKQLID